MSTPMSPRPAGSSPATGRTRPAAGAEGSGGPGGYQPDDDSPVFVISVAAQIAGLHPQTLRQYDRLGLVSPDRAGGRNRLYSMRDIWRLGEVSRLSADGVNLAGIQRILELEAQLEELRRTVAAFREEASGHPSTALVVWRPHRRDRRA